jgi:hypothetical protein
MLDAQLQPAFAPPFVGVQLIGDADLRDAGGKIAGSMERDRLQPPLGAERSQP